MSRDLPRAHAWGEHYEQVTRASRLVGVFVEHPRAPLGDLRTATLRQANELPEDHLVARSDERRKGREPVRGITWV